MTPSLFAWNRSGLVVVHPPTRSVIQLSPDRTSSCSPSIDRGFVREMHQPGCQEAACHARGFIFRAILVRTLHIRHRRKHRLTVPPAPRGTHLYKFRIEKLIRKRPRCPDAGTHQLQISRDRLSHAVRVHAHWIIMAQVPLGLASGIATNCYRHFGCWSTQLRPGAGGRRRTRLLGRASGSPAGGFGRCGHRDSRPTPDHRR